MSMWYSWVGAILILDTEESTLRVYPLVIMLTTYMHCNFQGLDAV